MAIIGTPIVVSGAALTSDSTYVDAIGQYNDNLLWEGSVTKAKAALEAVRWILANRSKITKTDHREVEFEIAGLKEAKKDLDAYLNVADTTSRSRAPWVRGRAFYDG